jgi:hypothetical protein
MANALTMKLEQFARFDQVERQRLDELLTIPRRLTLGVRTSFPKVKRSKTSILSSRASPLAPRCLRMANGKLWPSWFPATFAM